MVLRSHGVRRIGSLLLTCLSEIFLVSVHILSTNTAQRHSDTITNTSCWTDNPGENHCITPWLLITAILLDAVFIVVWVSFYVFLWCRREYGIRHYPPCQCLSRFMPSAATSLTFYTTLVFIVFYETREENKTARTSTGCSLSILSAFCSLFAFVLSTLEAREQLKASNCENENARLLESNYLAECRSSYNQYTI